MWFLFLHPPPGQLPSSCLLLIETCFHKLTLPCFAPRIGSSPTLTRQRIEWLQWHCWSGRWADEEGVSQCSCSGRVPPTSGPCHTGYRGAVQRWRPPPENTIGGQRVSLVGRGEGHQPSHSTPAKPHTPVAGNHLCKWLIINHPEKLLRTDFLYFSRILHQN